jgi:signal transduction histidine kinase
VKLDTYRSEYRDALVRYLDGAGEEALMSAYDIGRRAIESGLGILDVTTLHRTAVVELTMEPRIADASAFIRAAESFLAEALSPFEMCYRGVAEANAALRRLNELLEDEAKRIAHALHDQAGTILATAGLELDLAAHELPKGVRERLAGVRRLLDETGEQLRHLSHELRPTILDDLGLLPALEFLAEGVEHRTGVSVQVRGSGRERLPAPVETAIYRIVQEALNNAVLHGGAGLSVEVAVQRSADALRCLVVDDGMGFDVDAAGDAKERRGLGVLGMRERASSINGTLRIESSSGEGTTIEVCVPLDLARNSENGEMR